MIGKVVSHYRVTRKLGEGGMGIVYEAEDLNLPRRVALKFCSAARDPRLRAALLNEAHALCALIHPHIAEVYELSQTDEGEPFIVMELLPGSLDAELHRGRLGARQSERIATAVAKALEYAHSHGVVHRDIKPSNVRMTEAGQIKVTDFGIARAIVEAAATASVGEQRTVTIERFRGGTPGFMAPEVIYGHGADRRSDLFALGCVLYECLTAKQPFRGETVEETEANVLHLDPPRPSSLASTVSPAVDKITLKLLEKKSEDRYQSAGEAVAALEASDEQPVPKRVAWYRRRIFAYAGAVLVVLAGLALYWIYRPPPPVPPDAAYWYQKGLQALADGTYYQATKLFGRAVSKYPDFAMAHAHLAEAWDELEYSKEASQEMLKAMPLSGKSRVSRLDALHVRAIQASITGDVNSAVKYFRDLASKASEADRAEALLDLGRVFQRAQRPAEALAAYTEATKANQQSAAAFLRLGTMYFLQRNPVRAEEALTQAKELYEASSNVEGMTECLYQRARNEQDPVHRRELLGEALQSAQHAKNDQQIVAILLQSSHDDDQVGNRDRALSEANEALQVAERNGLENLKARALIEIGSNHWTNGGRPYLDQALRIAARTGAKVIEARARANLAALLQESGDTAQAAQFAELAFQFYSKAGYRGLASQVADILARCDQSRGDFAGALRHYATALEQLGSGGQKREVGLIHEGIAQIMGAQGRFPEALTELQKTRNSFEAEQYLQGVVSTTAALAEVSALLGRPQAAQDLIAEARRLTPRQASQELNGMIDAAAAAAELAAGKNAAALQHIQHAIASGALSDTESKFLAKVTLGLALTRLRRRSEAKKVADDTLSEAARLSNPALAMDGVLAALEEDLQFGDASVAAGRASELLPSVHEAGAREPEWRAWALLSQVETGEAARDAVARARECFRQLTANWAVNDVNSYSARPDISRLLVTLPGEIK
jgi:tetratricopeptide (TPR) repeat protein